MLSSFAMNQWDSELTLLWHSVFPGGLVQATWSKAWQEAEVNDPSLFLSVVEEAVITLSSRQCDVCFYKYFDETALA